MQVFLLQLFSASVVQDGIPPTFRYVKPKDVINYAVFNFSASEPYHLQLNKKTIAGILR